MKRNNIIKRIISLALVLSMCIGNVGALSMNQVVAAETDDVLEVESEEELEALEEAEALSEATKTKVKYRVLTKGEWSAFSKNGKKTKPYSENASIKNLDIRVVSPLKGKIQYKVCINQQWTKYTTYKNLQTTKGNIEAIKVRLTGQLAKKFDVYYSVHMTKGIWLDWAKNGKVAGGYGFNQRINSIKVILVKKGGKAPGDTTAPTLRKPEVLYTATANGAEIGQYSELGQVCGDGKSALTSMNMQLNGAQLKGDIAYRVGYDGGSFGAWSFTGQSAGLQDETKGFNRLQIVLTGAMKYSYNIYYRIYVKNYGWLDWAMNGEVAGTDGWDLPITAYQVRMVKKVVTVPLDMDREFIMADEQTYTIKVNKQSNCVTVYFEDIPIKAFICSTGNATPLGTYNTLAQYRWHLLIHDVWGQYCTRIVDSFLFHSVPYSECDNRTLIVSYYNKLGTTASAGCVRLLCGDAKWIYDNCDLRTQVTIYNSSDPGPLGKPTFPKLAPGQTWDPTDPAFQ